MKNVVILNDDAALRQPSAEYAPYYSRMSGHFAERGLGLFRASAWDFSPASGTFKVAQRWGIGGVTSMADVRPDAAWYKDSRISAATWAVADALGARFVNPLPFVLLARDKRSVAWKFPELSPRTAHLSAFADVADGLAAFPGDRVIIKPRTLYGGKGVEIVAKADVPARARELGAAANEFVVQEYVDATGGVPGLAQGFHDLRAYIVGDRHVLYCLRVPKKGDFRCNLGSGGSEEDFFPADRPVPAVFGDLVAKVRAAVGPRDGIWSVDMMMDRSGRAVLGEVTDGPGIDVNSSDPAYLARMEAALYGSIADLFARLTR